MKWMRFWAGACLVLIASGCSDDSGTVENEGVYSPLITGLASNHEPAVRGMENDLTVLVTNVNNYPLTYHWSAASGTLLDSTAATVTWVAPDSPGTYPVTVAIQAADGETQFFKTTTFQVVVDNQYERWTRSPEIQFDPAPVSGVNGALEGVIYAEYRSVATGEADVYYVPDLGLAPEQKTNGFLKLSGPSMRSDRQQIAFAAKATADDSQMVWVLPFAGGGPSEATPIGLPSPIGSPNTHRFMANPRYAHAGDWLIYNSDSAEAGIAGVPRPWFRDAAHLTEPPQRVFENVSLVSRVFWMPNWGPDLEPDGLPDSIVTMSFRFFGLPAQESNGLYKIPTTPPQNTTPPLWLDDRDASDPDWSPDGQHIVFSDPNGHSGERDIWIIRADTSDRSQAVRVTSGPADDSHPRFSADGNAIVFVSNRADRYGLNGIYSTERRGYNIWSVQRFDRP
jgi:hypothetical protein